MVSRHHINSIALSKFVVRGGASLKNLFLFHYSLWKSYGTEVLISVADITTGKGCAKLINEAKKIGPVGGIFNCAVLLRDAILENQTAASFKAALSVKAVATKHLDQISRKLCPEIEHFVVLSSITCGYGNAGQSNYGMANSVMERVIEDRATKGLPAKAIEVRLFLRPVSLPLSFKSGDTLFNLYFSIFFICLVRPNR